MKNKFKNIVYYLLEFLMVICMFATTILLIMKLTILNSNYLIVKLEENNYYSDLYNIIETDLEDYLLPSGFDKSILTDLFTEDMLKEEVNSIVKSLYYGEKINIGYDSVADNLKKNIDDYLALNNLKVSDEESFQKFVDEVLKIYIQRIKLTDYLDKCSELILKICKIVDILLISFLAIIIFVTILIKFVIKMRISVISLITTSLLLLIANYFLFEKINIMDILFWNESVSAVIQSIFFDLSNYFKITAIVFLGVGISFLIFIILVRRKAKKINIFD